MYLDNQMGITHTDEYQNNREEEEEDGEEDEYNDEYNSRPQIQSIDIFTDMMYLLVVHNLYIGIC